MANIYLGGHGPDGSGAGAEMWWYLLFVWFEYELETFRSPKDVVVLFFP
jgi:hypothetical protein